MKPFIQDGHTLVLRAVRKLLAVDGRGNAPDARLVIEEIETVDWASATIVGERHTLRLRLEGSAADVADAIDRLAVELGEVDAGGGGRFLADASLEDFDLTIDGALGVGHLTIEALTVEE